jgi:hypothetical protein
VFPLVLFQYLFHVGVVLLVLVLLDLAVHGLAFVFALGRVFVMGAMLQTSYDWWVGVYKPILGTLAIFCQIIEHMLQRTCQWHQACDVKDVLS